MADDKPVVYILHGDDPVEIAKFVDGLAAKAAESGMGDLNLSRLDARSDSDSDLRTAAMAMPFLAERRVVILEQAQVRLVKGSEERFKPFLDQVPPSTALVLVIHDEYEGTGARKGWHALPSNHWLWRWIESAGKRCHYKACRQPDQEDMPYWIRKKAEALGGQFSQAAATTLADQIGNDTQLATQEISKLLTYVDGARAVEPADVQLLTAAGGQVSVFDMVDALADGDAKAATRLLRGLLDASDPFSLFGMVVRQIRLVIQTREILDEGGGADTIMRDLSVPNFVARKLSNQAARFSLERLRRVYHRLLELDEGAKTGQWTLDLGLELFVAEMKR